MFVHHVDEIVAGDQHVRPCAEVALQSGPCVDRQSELCARSRDRLFRDRCERDSKVIARLVRVVALQLNRRGRRSGYDDRVARELGCRPGWIEIAQDAKHSGLRKGNWVLKDAIRDKRRVPVHEEFEVLAHDKRMEEPLVNHVETGDGAILPGITDEELHDGRATWRRRRGDEPHVQVKLDGIRDPGDQSHAASPADARVVGSHIGIHGADVDDAGGWIRGLRRGLGRGRLFDGNRFRPAGLIGHGEQGEATDARGAQSSLDPHKLLVDPRRRDVKGIATGCVVLAAAVSAGAHGFGSSITWNREVSRIVYAKCASCHRPEGTAFSLMTYSDAQPKANEIKEAVLARRMPPWGAVKGFGHFRNDQSLTQEQIELITKWVDGGIRRGNNPRQLPEVPTFTASDLPVVDDRAITVQGPTVVSESILVRGLQPQRVSPGQSIRIVAVLPGGSVEPLVWLHDYQTRYAHPFLFREPVRLPAGTQIQGVPADAVVALLRAGK